jgi:hypothetical protein
MGEAIYNAVLNFLVLPMLVISWYLLRKRVKSISNPVTIRFIKRVLNHQMIFYVVFFTIRASGLFFNSMWYLVTDIGKEGDYSIGPVIFFFLHSSLGDFPLVCKFIYFLFFFFY